MISAHRPSVARYGWRRMLCLAAALSLLLLAGCVSQTTVKQNATTVKGLTLIDRVNSQSIPYASAAFVTAKCLSNERVVGGGFSISPQKELATTSTGDDIQIPYDALLASYPSALDAWTVTVDDRINTATEGSILVIAHAICTPSPILTQISSGTQAYSGDEGEATYDSGPWKIATCPPNTTLLGGGFQIDPVYAGIAPLPIISMPYFGGPLNGIPLGWKVRAQGSDDDAAVTAYAVCTKIPVYNIKLLGLQNVYTKPKTGVGVAPILYKSNEYTFTGTGAAPCLFGSVMTSAGFIIPKSQQDAQDQYVTNGFQGTTHLQTFFVDYTGKSAGEWQMRYTIYDPQWQTFNTGKFVPSKLSYTSFGAYLQPVCVEVYPEGSSPPTATATSPSTPTPPTPTPTLTPPTLTPPTLTPTPTPPGQGQPTPTNTVPSGPQCTQLVGGTGSMNADNTYLDVESATGIGPQSQGADVQWSPSASTMQPLSGAQLADTGTIGVNGFNTLTCAQIKGATYGGGSAPVADGEVFLIKTAAGRYAKVLVSLVAGNPNPALRWVTDNVS